MTRARSIWRVVAVNAVVILLILAAFELVCQKALYPGRMRLVRDIDHRIKPGRPGQQGRVTINSDGIRSLLEADDFNEGGLNILFLGDSFVFGPRLLDDETVPQLLEAKARELHPGKAINVVNFGWISSSPLLSLHLLEDLGRKYSPDAVVLGFDMTDFQDDIKYTKMLERKGVYWLLNVAPMTLLSARKLIGRVEMLLPLHDAIFGVPPQRFFATENPLSETLPYFAYTQGYIESIRALCTDELGATFTLIVLPRHYQYSDRECPDNWEAHEYEILGPYCLEPFRYFENLRHRVDYPVHSLLEDFRDTDVHPLCFEDDPHWNAAGAQVAADAVYERLKSDGCFD